MCLLKPKLINCAILFHYLHILYMNLIKKKIYIYTDTANEGFKMIKLYCSFCITCICILITIIHNGVTLRVRRHGHSRWSWEHVTLPIGTRCILDACSSKLKYTYCHNNGICTLIKTNCRPKCECGSGFVGKRC